jgi:hypothetical protein
MSIEINGWKDSPRTDLPLDPGNNNDLPANEHLVILPSGPGVNLTGFIPPTFEDTWMMTVSNGGVDNIVFTNDDAGSTAGNRVLMLPGSASLTLSVGQTQFFVFTPNLAAPAYQGWYPLIPGVMA